jgi:prepilin-type N-terminal cleavage/methylation domain-containing protein
MDVLQKNALCPKSGMTLIECLLALVILSLILVSGIPSGMAMVSRTTITATQERLMQHIIEARINAKANYSVAYICPSEDGMICLKSRHWHQGWMSYLDKNSNRRYDIADTLITRYQPAKPLNINVTLNAAGRAKSVKIDPDGLIRTSGNFRICASDSTTRKIDTIKLSNQGRLAKEQRVRACS